MSAFATTAQRQAALLPADLYLEVTDQYRDAAQEIGGSLEMRDAGKESQQEKEGSAGAAAFDGAPKPVPGDEFAAVAYGRNPDARSNTELMRVAGQITPDTVSSATFHSIKAEQAAAIPEQQQEVTSQQAPQGNRPNYATLNAEHDKAREAVLLPREAQAEAMQGKGSQNDNVLSQERKDFLLPALVVAEVVADVSRPDMARQQQRGVSMSM